MSVRILTVQREFDWTIWACPAARARWEAAGWTVREDKAPPHALKCGDRDEYGCCAPVDGEV